LIVNCNSKWYLLS